MLSQFKARILLLLVVSITAVYAQVTISPTSLFIDNKSKFATLLIMNGSEVAQEVKLSWEFGYPKTDEDGNIGIIYGDYEEAALHSAADWIRGFPKSFVLEPGARQTVRITVKAPRKLADGTYWSRLKTTSNAISTPVGESKDGNISAQISFQFNQVTSVFYKQGKLNTELNITGVENKLDENFLRIFTEYIKSGNSPFLGTMAVSVLDEKGKTLKDEKIFVSIYYAGMRRFDLDVSTEHKDLYQIHYFQYMVHVND